MYAVVARFDQPPPERNSVLSCASQLQPGETVYHLAGTGQHKKTRKQIPLFWEMAVASYVPTSPEGPTLNLLGNDGREYPALARHVFKEVPAGKGGIVLPADAPDVPSDWYS